MGLLNNINTNKQRYLLQFVIPIFYLLIFLKNYVGEQNKGIQLVFTGLYIILGVTLTLFLAIKLLRNSLIIVVMCTLIVLSLITSIFSNNYRIEDNILSFTYFGIALIPIFITLSYKFFKIFAYSIICFFIIQIIKGVDPNEIFDVSRNYISVLLLIGLGYHFISCFQNDKNPSFFILIVSLAISIWATGRGGIITFSFLLVCYSFIVNVKTKYKLLIIILILIICLAAYIYLYDLLFEFGLGRFENMGLEGERSTMNSDYLHNCLSSIRYFLFGCPYVEIPSIVEVDLNPHNSLIRLHVYYGIVGFVVVVFLILTSILNFIYNKYLLYLFLLLSLILRSFTDSVAFHGSFDPLIYFLLFYSIKNIVIVK